MAAENIAECPALVAYLDSLVEKLRGHLTGAVVRGEVVDVHQARVATRRLKAGLDLFEPVLTKQHREELGRTLKKLRRRLGALRDHDVMIERVGSLRRKRFAGAQVWMLQRLHERRRKLAGDLVEDVNLTKVLTKVEGQWKAVRAEMVEAREAIGSLLRDSVGVQMEAFAGRADGIVGAKVEKTIVDSGSTQSPHPDPLPEYQEREKCAGVVAAEGAMDPHELRIAGKALRYTLEMVAEAGSAPPKKSVSAFKRMQEALGEWHDGVVLAQAGMRLSLEEELALHDAGTQREVLGLAVCVLEGAEKAFEKFGELWRAEGEGIRGALEEGMGMSIKSQSAPELTGA